MMLAAALAACASPRPPGTDLFGRPITQPSPPAPAAAPAPAPSATRTIGNGGPEDLLAGVDLRPLPATTALPAVRRNARLVEARDYIVQPGDTLRGIGNRTGAGSEAIAAANSLAAPYVLRPGQRLAIPAGLYHEVGAGETGIAIARAYGVAWSAMVAENTLVEPYVLRVGQRLRLPGGAAVPMTPEESAAAFTLDIDDIVTGSVPAAAPPPAIPPASSPARPAVPPALAAATRFVWPLEGRLLQRFGPAGGGRVNDGIKIAASLGAPVRAAAGGRIAYAGTDVPLLGGLILIEHSGGWISAYGHLDRVAVRNGDVVESGAIIATAGESGQVREPQLHFELRQNRRPVDPLRQLPAR
jgi:murein DD-endopeptidase MepM/ murein hydrolase activator NlpD